MKAIVIGGTGLVGRALLAELSADPAYERIVSHARRAQPALAKVVAAPLDAHVEPAEVAFCALGTTIKAAGSQEAFRAVDHDLVVRFARACRDAGVASFHVVSAMGASERSRAFYSCVKGEMERDVRALGFPGACVYRPSLLLAEREEPRPAERAGVVVMRAFDRALPRRWKGITPETVARAMARHARSRPIGWHVHPNEELFALSTSAPDAP